MDKVIKAKLISIVSKYPDKISIEQIKDIPVDVIETLYLSMLKIRLIEEKIVDLLYKEQIKCPTHLCIGQEAISVSVSYFLNKNDYVFGTHRSHGHYLAKGGGVKELFAELLVKEEGCSKGRGGSMHIAAPHVGFMGSSSIVAGNIPLAAGAALASKIRNDNRIAVVFFGDGATDEGVFYEVVNFASLYKLPLLFVCENNFFSTHLPIFLRQNRDNLAERVSTYGIPVKRIYGNDVFEVYRNSQESVNQIRQGKGPVLLECDTFRFRAHVGPWEDVDLGFRSKDLVEEWLRRCPLKMMEEVIFANGILSKDKKKKYIQDINKEIREVVISLKESSCPCSEDIHKGVFFNNPIYNVE